MSETSPRSVVTLECTDGTASHLSKYRLETQSAQFAHLLRRFGATPGKDAVALLAENHLEIPIVVLGAHKGGFKHLPLNTSSPVGDVIDILCELQPRVVVVSNTQLARPGMQEALTCLPFPVNIITIGGFCLVGTPLDNLLNRVGPMGWKELETATPGKGLALSGGSTGRPKVISYQDVPEESPGGGLLLPAKEGVQLLPKPLYHAYSLMLKTLLAGTHLVFMEQWNAPRFLEIIQRHRVTHTLLSPTLMARLVKVPMEEWEQYDLSSLRLILHGGGACPLNVKHELLARVSENCQVTEVYGMSEGVGLTLIDKDGWLQRPGSVGKPPEGWRVVIRDKQGNELPSGATGIVWFIRGGNQRMRHLNNEEETNNCYAVRNGRLEGTVHDLGYVDKAGFLHLRGRDQEMVISGGTNIYPANTERALYGHPAVASVKVVGIPDSKGDMGQVLAAVVELTEGFSPTRELEEELGAFCHEHAGALHVPVRWVSAKPPWQETGKINRQELLALISAHTN